MLTRRHEQKLAEVNALAHEFHKSTQEVLERISEARDELGAQHRLVAFVHIPKTAGGTVNAMFARAYSTRAVRDAGNYLRSPESTTAKVSGRRIARARVTVGHVPYGLFREHLPPDTRYLTFLREPVDRVLSYYHRHVRRRGDFSDERRPVVTDSIEEALEIGLPEITNLATRFLCGHPSPFGDLPASALDDAKANLADFMFVGLQERFDESVALLQRMLGLGVVLYEERHVDSERPAVEEIPEEQRSLIVDYNRLDADLYTFAAGLFEDAVADADEGLAADAEALRSSSAVANQAALQDARDWLDRELPFGTTKPQAVLRSEAGAAGISLPALRRLLRLLAAKRLHEHDGPTWTRTQRDAGSLDPGRR